MTIEICECYNEQGLAEYDVYALNEAGEIEECEYGVSRKEAERIAEGYKEQFGVSTIEYTTEEY